MKRLLLIIISIGLCTSIFSQTLTIDAGENRYVCKTAQGVIMFPQIGGNPSVTNGTPPYKIKWETNYILGGVLAFSASFFLDDTTIANPNLIEIPTTGAPITFYVSVIDSLLNTAVDSITVSNSSYILFPILHSSDIFLGQSTQISITFFGGVPPYNYHWSPDYNISDITSSSPIVWPDTSLSYNCLILDSIGCPLYRSFEVLVFPVSNTNKILQENLKIYPNPTQDWLIIELKESEIKNIKITDMSGKIVLQQYDLINNQLDISSLSLGIYVLSIEDKAGNTGQFQILKQ